jgi:bacteriorhodopsin
VTALVATGKVFSPQFLLWLIVLVPLVPGMTGRIATIACLVAMLLTTSLFPFRYFALSQAAALQTTLLLVRNGIVLAVFVLLVRALRRETGAL